MAGTIGTRRPDATAPVAWLCVGLILRGGLASAARSERKDFSAVFQALSLLCLR